MPRANRHNIPGYIWHITHRCHKKEFLFKFSKDKKRWRDWLHEAKKRFELSILNFTITSNHIHLLVLDGGNEAISKSIQLIAGRSGQEYNRRKKRKGAFWEDRYHATAIESGKHLFRCMSYIDMNMVRAGVVKHPSEWPFSGYREIQDPPHRGGLVDRKSLLELCGEKDEGFLRNVLKELSEQALDLQKMEMDEKWSESVAVGSLPFVEETKKKLGIKAKGRKIIEDEEGFMIRQLQAPFEVHFTPENTEISPENTYFWREILLKTIR